MSKIKKIYFFIEKCFVLFFLRMAGRWSAIFYKDLEQGARGYLLKNYQVNNLSPERAEEIVNEMISFRKSLLLSFIPFLLSMFALLLSFLALAFSVFK